MTAPAYGDRFTAVLQGVAEGIFEKGRQEFVRREEGGRAGVRRGGPGGVAAYSFLPLPPGEAVACWNWRSTASPSWSTSPR